MKGQYIVYCLIDPTIDKVMYIGKSSYGLSRPKSHLRPSIYTHGTAPVYEWIRKLATQGTLPVIEIIEDCASDAECYAAELYYMRLFDKEEGPLLNYIRNYNHRTPRKKHSTAHRNYLSFNSKKRMEVVNLTTGERFISARAAAKAYKCDHRGICRTCNGEYKFYKKCEWRWAHNYSSVNSSGLTPTF